MYTRFLKPGIIAVVVPLLSTMSPAPKTELSDFKKHVISRDFISEGVAVGDVNNDGQTDILAGPCWFESSW